MFRWDVEICFWDTRQGYQRVRSSSEARRVGDLGVGSCGKAFGLLAGSMNTTPELQVTRLLNTQRTWGDTTVADHLVRKCANRKILEYLAAGTGLTPLRVFDVLYGLISP